MPKKTVALDYNRCDPDRCGDGVCPALAVCEYGSLTQESPHSQPEINPARWCRGCAKCVKACPLKAIRMM